MIEQGIEQLVRTWLPMPEEVGDVSFDAPSGTWSAQLSRLTVDIFLFGIGRSTQPPRQSADRIGPDGRPERRRPLPMVELNYLVSAYAGSTRDEHQLLSEVFTCFAINPVLPPEHLVQPLDVPVQLQLGSHEQQRIKDVWGGVGGSLRPSFELMVTAALDSVPWQLVPPRVERIEGLVAPIPRART